MENPKASPELNWANVLFLALSPVIGIGGTAAYAYFHGVTRWELIPFFALMGLTGLSITGGYHRYFSHRSYKANRALEFLYLVFGACALENGVLHWASDHRRHHRFTDTDLDPYNITKGFFHAHMGWIFYKERPNESFSNVPDLLADPLVLWQERYYLPVAITVGFLGPTLIGAIAGRAVGGLLWGGFLRLVLVHHTTFLINSWAHMFGSQPYETANTARDSWWLAFLTHGEGYHNFHHKFEADYRNGVRWYHWDPTKWLIWALSRVGWTAQLHRVPAEIILKARADLVMNQAEQSLLSLPEGPRAVIRRRLAASRIRIEQLMASWARARLIYLEQLRATLNRDRSRVPEGSAREWLAAQQGETQEALLRYQELLAECRRELRKSTSEWKHQLQQHFRSFQPQTT